MCDTKYEYTEKKYLGGEKQISLDIKYGEISPTTKLVQAFGTGFTGCFFMFCPIQFDLMLLFNNLKSIGSKGV